MIDVGEQFEWAPLYQASIATPYFGVVMEPKRLGPYTSQIYKSLLMAVEQVRRPLYFPP